MVAPEFAPTTLRLRTGFSVWRGLGFIVLLVALAVTAAFVAFAAQYSIVGIEPTMDLWPRILSQTYPVDTLPIVDWDKAMFAQHPTAFYLHVIFCPLALALGPLQLWRGLHERAPGLHRGTGIIYLVSVAIGAPAGFVLSQYDYLGPIAVYGYAWMAFLTLTSTLLAVWSILRRDVDQHRRWMIRSYVVLWTSSIGFRLLLIFAVPSLATALGPLPGSFDLPYTALIFLMPALGLFLADVWLWLRPMPTLSRRL